MDHYFISNFRYGNVADIFKIISKSTAHSTSTLAECNTFCWLINVGKKMLSQYINALWPFVGCFTKCSNIHVSLTVELAINQHCVY